MIFTTVLVVLVLLRGNSIIVFADIFCTGIDFGKKAASFVSSEQYGKLLE